jgi:c-di-GMP-binding flagellar brake protein YcgR
LNDRTPDTPQPSDASDAIDGADDYRLDAPGEVQSWLRELMQAQARVQLSTPDGALLHTVVMAVDPAHGVISLEMPADAGLTESVVASPEVNAIAYLDRIKLAFEVSGLVAVRGTGGTVLRAALPARLYRFQRRQAYRVQSPGQMYPALRLNLPEGLRLRVLNVSSGGLALQWPQAAAPGFTGQMPPAPVAGTELSGTLELEREVNFAALLRVQHVTPGEEAAPHQLGCAFVSLAPTATRALQLFIDQAQKRERMLKRPG